MGDINKHIEDYLDYYYKFQFAPEYAVLIKGNEDQNGPEWGTVIGK